MAKKPLSLHTTLIVSALLFFAMPWIAWEGVHLLLFHFEAHRMELFFVATEASVVQLIIAAVLLWGTLVVGLNLTLSRTFCGRFCPTSLMASLEEYFKYPTLFYLLAVLFSLVMAYTLVGYFTPIGALVVDTLDGASIAVLIAGLALFFFVLFTQLRSWYCTTLCPYFFVSAILPQGAKEHYALLDSEACLHCDKCVQVCPIEELDVKNGFDERCIECGACATACENVMRPKGKSSLIGKFWGRKHLWQSFSPKGYVLALLLLGMMGVAWVYTLDTSHLESCQLSNAPLYEQH